MAFVHSLVISDGQHRKRAIEKGNDKSSGLFSLLTYFLGSNDNAVILPVEDGKKEGMLRQLQDDARNIPGGNFLGAYIQSGRIMLVETSLFHQKGQDNADPEWVLKKWIEVAKGLRRKPTSKNVIIISDQPMVMKKVLRNNLHRLIEYESRVSEFGRLHQATIRKLGLREAVCCYNKQTIDKMEPMHLITLMRCHDSMVDLSQPERHALWHPIRIQNVISRGITNVLGRDSDRLIFHTLKVVYGIDREKVVSDPDVFEARLTKILGSFARVVIDSIASELRRDIYTFGEWDTVAC